MSILFSFHFILGISPNNCIKQSLYKMATWRTTVEPTHMLTRKTAWQLESFGIDLGLAHLDGGSINSSN